VEIRRGVLRSGKVSYFVPRTASCCSNLGARVGGKRRAKSPHLVTYLEKCQILPRVQKTRCLAVATAEFQWDCCGARCAAPLIALSLARQVWRGEIREPSKWWGSRAELRAEGSRCLGPQSAKPLEMWGSASMRTAWDQCTSAFPQMIKDLMENILPNIS